MNATTQPSPNPLEPQPHVPPSRRRNILPRPTNKPANARIRRLHSTSLCGTPHQAVSLPAIDSHSSTRHHAILHVALGTKLVYYALPCPAMLHRWNKHAACACACVTCRDWLGLPPPPPTAAAAPASMHIARVTGLTGNLPSAHCSGRRIACSDGPIHARRARMRTRGNPRCGACVRAFASRLLSDATVRLLRRRDVTRWWWPCSFCVSLR
jgi:hypothetical protein